MLAHSVVAISRASTRPRLMRRHAEPLVAEAQPLLVPATASSRVVHGDLVVQKLDFRIRGVEHVREQASVDGHKVVGTGARRGGGGSGAVTCSPSQTASVRAHAESYQCRTSTHRRGANAGETKAPSIAPADDTRLSSATPSECPHRFPEEHAIAASTKPVATP